MSRRKRIKDKANKGPHQNKYSKDSHASEVTEEIRRRDKGPAAKPYEIKKEEKREDKTRIQEASQEIDKVSEKKPEGLIKILYVTNEPHDDKVEEKLRRAGFECCVFYTRKEAENALPNGDYAGVFIENLRIGLDKGTQASYSDGIGLARSIKAASLPLVVLAEDIFYFINRVKGIGQDDRVMQRPSDSGYYVPAAKSVFKKK